MKWELSETAARKIADTLLATQVATGRVSLHDLREACRRHDPGNVTAFVQRWVGWARHDSEAVVLLPSILLSALSRLERFENAAGQFRAFLEWTQESK